MRKLKLQVQMSLDGFIAGPKGEMDWMTWTWDEKLNDFVNGMTKAVDLILLGKNVAGDFVNAWEERARDKGADWFTHKMNESQKIVFSRSLEKSEWARTQLATGSLTDEVNSLKQSSGGDIIAYGGANFVSSLIDKNLIDDYYFFINPVAIGDGMPIFRDMKNRLRLDLVAAHSFECGITVLNYRPFQVGQPEL